MVVRTWAFNAMVLMLLRYCGMGRDHSGRSGTAPTSTEEQASRDRLPQGTGEAQHRGVSDVLPDGQAQRGYDPNSDTDREDEKDEDDRGEYGFGREWPYVCQCNFGDHDCERRVREVGDVCSHCFLCPDERCDEWRQEHCAVMCPHFEHTPDSDAFESKEPRTAEAYEPRRHVERPHGIRERGHPYNASQLRSMAGDRRVRRASRRRTTATAAAEPQRATDVDHRPTLPMSPPSPPPPPPPPPSPPAPPDSPHGEQSSDDQSDDDQPANSDTMSSDIYDEPFELECTEGANFLRDSSGGHDLSYSEHSFNHYNGSDGGDVGHVSPSTDSNRQMRRQPQTRRGRSGHTEMKSCVSGDESSDGEPKQQHAQLTTTSSRARAGHRHRRTAIIPTDSDGDGEGDTTQTDQQSCDDQSASPLDRGRKRKREVVATTSYINVTQGRYNHRTWKVSGAVGGIVTITNKVSSATYKIPRKRVNKAMRNLDTDHIAGSVINNRQSCACKRQCNTTVTIRSIMKLRERLYTETSDEVQAKEWLVQRLCDGAGAQAKDGQDSDLDDDVETSTTQYVINGHEVCGNFWRKAYGISKFKMTRIRRMAASGGRVSVHGNKGRQNRGLRRQYDVCYAFWDNFFADAQRPNHEIRLFPANLTFHAIYEDFFVAWRNKFVDGMPSSDREWHRLAGLPSMTTFRRARTNKSFADVKVRPKHYHAKCKECAMLTARRLRGFQNDVMKTTFQARWEAHQEETRGWHQREESLKARARLSPHYYQLLQFDDTSSWGCPSFGNRPPKNLTTSRLHFVPFHILDYAEGDQAYIYTVKGRYSKGGNRLCTTLYHVARRCKHNPDMQTSKARHLTCIADNYSENKCNTVFQFASELVWRDWYDKIDFEFGPTGHTHNGCDAVHFIHNVCANRNGGHTLGEFVRKWDMAWHSADKKPTACVLDAQYDFDARYSEMPRLMGFTKTKYEQESARAFRVERSDKGYPVLWWKRDPADLHWLGQEGKPQHEDKGFILLTKLPPGAPETIQPRTTIMKQVYRKQLTGKTMMQVLEAESENPETMRRTVQWLWDTSHKGVIPYSDADDEEDQREAMEQPRHFRWGKSVRIGVTGHDARFQWICRDETLQSAAEFWKLPSWLTDHIREAHDASRRELQDYNAMPYLRYDPTVLRRVVAQADDAGDAGGGGMDDNVQQVAHADTEAAAINDIRHASEAASAGRRNRGRRRRDAGGGNENAPAWGAPFADCVVGKVAMVSCEFPDGGRGINLLQITSTDKTAETFTGKPMVFQGWGISSKEEECLEKKWQLKGGRTPEETEYGYNVLRYFMLNRAKKIPAAVKNFVKKWDADHPDEPIFYTHDNEERDHASDKEERYREEARTRAMGDDPDFEDGEDDEGDVDG